MWKLQKYKTESLSNFSQLILLQEDGFIVKSCDSIFPTDALKDKPFTQYFPFLESIFQLLLQLKVGDEEMKFAKIDAPLEGLHGVYDFTFSKVKLDDGEFILWSIFDYTDLYEDFKLYQQKRNELEIHREMLEIRNRSLHHQKDILTQKNLALLKWDQVRRDYYEKVRLALQSPVNALDGLTFLLSNISKEADQDYLTGLRAAVQHLQEVLAEFEMVSLIEGDHHFSEVIEFNPREVIASATQELFSTIPARRINLEVHLDPKLSTRVLGNPRHLHQIMYQLLLNAQKFGDHPDLELHLKVVPGEKEKLLLIDFEILQSTEDPEHFPGQEDHKNEATTSLIFRLSLIKKLVELEGGNIAIEDQADHSGFKIIGQLRYPVAE